MERIILRVMEKYLKDNAGISHSQHKFMRGKFCLRNLTSFKDKMTQIVDLGKP